MWGIIISDFVNATRVMTIPMTNFTIERSELRASCRAFPWVLNVWDQKTFRNFDEHFQIQTKNKKKLQIFPKDQKPIQNPFPISKRPLSGSMWSQTSAASWLQFLENRRGMVSFNAFFFHGDQKKTKVAAAIYVYVLKITPWFLKENHF